MFRRLNRELTGSRLTIMPWITIKTGDAMVGMQGRIMDRAGYLLRSSVVPSVYRTWSTGYVMETLQPIYRDQWDWRIIEGWLKPIWSAYDEDDLYVQAPPFSPTLLYELLANMSSELLYSKQMRSLPYLELYYRNSNDLTHGDCTAENTMQNYCCVWKILDWQPVRPAYIPAHRAVDYGKMMQSYVQNVLDGAGDVAHNMNQCVRICLDGHIDAAFWCAVHFERIARRSRSDDTLKKAKRGVQECLYVMNYVAKEKRYG